MKAALKLIITLFLVCGIAAGSLAFVNAATKERIAEFAAIEREEARKKVFPDADAFTESRSYDDWAAQKLDEKAGDVFEWAAVKAGNPIGYVFQTSVQGYGGIVKIIFGVDLEGRVTGLRILSHTETAGLGAKITSDAFLKQYAGKTVEQLVLKKDDPSKGALDAISAATISSRAVAKAVQDAMAKAFAAGTDAVSASSKKGGK